MGQLDLSAKPHTSVAREGSGLDRFLKGRRAPLELTADFVEALAAHLPELPDEKKRRFIADHGLSEYDAGVITADAALAAYYEAVVAAGIDAKKAANWVTGEFSRLLNHHAADGLRADGQQLVVAARYDHRVVQPLKRLSIQEMGHADRKK